MSTVNVPKTTFGLGSSASELLKNIFVSSELEGYNPAFIMNTQVIAGTTQGNSDFPDGFNVDYVNAPFPEDLVPNIESPGVGNTQPQSDINSTDDLKNKPEALRDLERASTGDNGSNIAPGVTSAVISAHRVKDPSMAD